MFTLSILASVQCLAHYILNSNWCWGGGSTTVLFIRPFHVVLYKALYRYFGVGIRVICDDGVGHDLAHIKSRKNKHGIREANEITSNYPKVDMPNSIIAIIWTHILEQFVIRYGSKNGHQKNASNKYWTMCLRYAKDYRFNSQHNWGGGGGATWPLIDHKNMSFTKYKANGYEHDLDLLIISH